MRRLALLSSTLLLAGCGFGHFLGDSFTLPGADPNAPSGSSENMLRVRAQQVAIEPLLPEPGNVWPGPPPPEPTLADIQRQQNEQPATPAVVPSLPDHRQPTPGGLAAPGRPGAAVLPPGTPGSARPGTATVPSPTAGAPAGALAGTPAQPPVNAFRQAPGSGNIVIPNGNGTSTVIGPNGSVSTIPTPR